MSIFSQYKAIKLIPHIHSLVHEINCKLTKLQGDEMNKLKEILERTRAATKAMEERYAKQVGDLRMALAERDEVRAAFEAFKAEVAEFAEGVESDAADEEKIGAPATGGSMGGINE
jgi:hypothetical protein